MSTRLRIAAALVAVAPCLAVAQSPVADALRAESKRQGKNLVAAAEEMPADKFSYAPTKEQMSFGAIQMHLADGNDALCGSISGQKPPTRAKLDEKKATKEQLIARLKESFAFCDQALAKLDDSKLTEKMSLFGMSMTRAGFILMTAADWADHYSQESNYLRLNGKLPPTAKKGM
jgi:uncharacterized damage-inducible protein DinB